GRQSDAALALLGQLGRNERALWLVSGAYTQQTGGRQLWADLSGRNRADSVARINATALAPSIHVEDAQRLYDQITDATFEHHGDGSTRIPTGHPEDGCYMRA
ncbi:hypothetical protein, partial [Umezawaea beigongshangensis]|uniref:hypothetical protein n=1 Tax=Umezawaea beigongshangensis TaxID=2780383 RepID=UPI0018F18F05